MRLDPQGVLLGFGLLALATGLYFHTPMPLQPMKAIATAAITHPGTTTPGALFAATVGTGLLWLALGATRAVSWLAALTSRPVVRGTVPGLGLSFMYEGVRFMHQSPLLAVSGAVPAPGPAAVPGDADPARVRRRHRARRRADVGA